MNIKRIKKLIKEIENELPKSGNGKNEYHEIYSSCITIHIGDKTFREIQKIAISEDKPMSTVCRELITDSLLSRKVGKKRND